MSHAGRPPSTTVVEDPARIAVIIGSTREGRAGAGIARWFLTHVSEREDVDLDVIDLRDLVLPMHYPEERTPGQHALAERIGRADGFVVVTPEYNHSYPASLKHAIDVVHEQWFAKPVGFVSYGGMAQGLRAVEHLRMVFAELHAVTVRDGVSVNLFDGSVDDNGWVLDSNGAGHAAKTMVNQLLWWAHALRDARAIRPYGA
ncbi:NADPH-dependent FMN reductase [Pseudonocardia acaciae]|uniref:NADPH-dependent FMN reductase n=1 Tax=Pseudonocardia acaciae TaxID=551276 RepID=UPI0006880063|nr:NAD(P)H-dependent oxidoreductase [Pseudonocardia acaciae]